MSYHASTNNMTIGTDKIVVILPKGLQQHFGLSCFCYCGHCLMNKFHEWTLTGPEDFRRHFRQDFRHSERH